MKEMIIIGGGIVGLSIAYHLLKEGRAVTVIDRQDQGQATDAAAGIICPWLSQRRNKAWYTLAKNGAAYYPQFVQQLEQDAQMETGYERVGVLSLHRDADHRLKTYERAKRKRLEAKEIGEIQLLSDEEAQRYYPLLEPDAHALYVEGAARVNGRSLRKALYEACLHLGATLIQGSAQFNMSTVNKVLGIHVNGTMLQADNYIIAAGAWAKELLLPLGCHLSIRGQKAQIVHVTLPTQETDNWSVIMPPTDQYIVPFTNGQIVLGATHEDDCEYDVRVTAGGMQEVLSKALAISPKLKEATVEEVRVGYRPFTPNSLPVIGEIPGHASVHIVNGLGASGLTMGPYIGQQLSKALVNRPTDLDLNPYRIEQINSTK